MKQKLDPPSDVPPSSLPPSEPESFWQLVRRIVVGFLMALGLACCFQRSPAEEARYPGFCLNPATGEAQPRYDELCKDGGIVCPNNARVSGLPDAPGIGFHCE